jgi:hypothetical protein
MMLAQPLRLHRERQDNCAAEQRDELAARHSITSSAPASNVDGTKFQKFGLFAG